jgi:hypothetical protein
MVSKDNLILDQLSYNIDNRVNIYIYIYIYIFNCKLAIAMVYK